MPTNASNGSYDDLVRLNDQRFITLIPAVALFSLYMLLGLIGNTLVCYIIGFKFQSNNQNFLIVWLAILDLLSCLLAIPTDIVDMRFSYIFPSATACKILRFIMAFTCMGSAFVLTVIAIDRHRKICNPLAHQMTRKDIKVALTIALGIATFLSWPAPVIFGLRVYPSPIKGQEAQDCSTSDEMKDTIFPKIYTGVLFLVFVVLCILLISLYCRIMTSIKRHSRGMKAKSGINFKRSKSPDRSELTNISVNDTVADEIKTKAENNDVDKQISAKISQNNPVTNKESESKQVNGGLNEDMNVIVSLKSDALCRDGALERQEDAVGQAESDDVKQDSGISTASQSQQPSDGKSSVDIVTTKESARRRRSRSFTLNTKSKKKVPGADKLERKTTRIAFLITLVFILSFLPYLSLQITKAVDEDFDYSLKGTSFLLQNVFLRSYYINSISNPIIYGVLNRRFRDEGSRIFCKIFWCR